MNPSALAIRYSSVLIAVAVTAVVWGSIAFQTLPRQESPALTWRLANVITRLPGATPQRTEALITDVLERYVAEVDEVEHVYSVSRAGLSLVQIELSDDVTEADPVWQDVRHRLSEASAELPADVIGPELDDEIMGTFAQLIAISGACSSGFNPTLGARIARCTSSSTAPRWWRRLKCGSAGHPCRRCAKWAGAPGAFWPRRKGCATYAPISATGRSSWSPG